MLHCIANDPRLEHRPGALAAAARGRRELPRASAATRPSSYLVAGASPQCPGTQAHRWPWLRYRRR